MTRTKKAKRHDFFIFKRNPFRPLYSGNVGFRVPPSAMEQSLSRSGFHLWLFRERAVARLMAATNKAELAPLHEFAQLDHGRPFASKPLPFTRKPSTRSTLKDLA